MLATAISSGVDVAFVVAVQVLRVVVMLLVAPAIARCGRPQALTGIGDCGDRVFLRYCVPWS